MQFLFVTALQLGSIFQIFAQCTMKTPCTPLTGGESFRRPNEQVSEEGLLSTRVEVRMATFNVDWLRTKRRLYNGTFPGPTLRFKAGDRVRLDLVNTLQEPDYVDSGPNTFRFPNSTNVHTHGLHISSEEPQDNVLLKIAPNETFKYDYRIFKHQPAGTFWYHPHLHGSGFFQNHGGMAGMLIVEDDPQTMPPQLDAASCPNNCDRDIPMVLQLFQYLGQGQGSFSEAQREIHDSQQFRLDNVKLVNGSDNLEEWLENPSNNIKYYLVNGQLQPKLRMRRGKMHRFRLLNGGAQNALALHVTGVDGSGSPCEVKEIALDGHYLEKPRKQKLGRSLVVAAGRVDWLIMCRQAGIYELRSTFLDVDDLSLGPITRYTGLLVTLIVEGSTSSQDRFPDSLPAKPSYMRDLRHVLPSEVCGKFAVEMTPTATINRENYTSSFRYKARVDTIQEWYLTNTDIRYSHTFHMHVNSFQVISYNKYVGPYGVDDGGWNWRLFSQKGKTCKWQHTGYNASVKIVSQKDPLKCLGHEKRQAGGGAKTIGYARPGDWMDTILLPPLVNITVRFRTDTFTGVVLVHCHVLEDADNGMTMLTEIVKEGRSLKANTTSAGAYQGSCMENNPVDQRRHETENWNGFLVIVWAVLSQIWRSFASIFDLV